MNWIALIGAITALVTAIGGVVALVVHTNGPAHQAPAKHQSPPAP
jgi:hypothetical protein